MHGMDDDTIQESHEKKHSFLNSTDKPGSIRRRARSECSFPFSLQMWCEMWWIDKKLSSPNCFLNNKIFVSSLQLGNSDEDEGLLGILSRLEALSFRVGNPLTKHSMQFVANNVIGARPYERKLGRCIVLRSVCRQTRFRCDGKRLLGVGKIVYDSSC